MKASSNQTEVAFAWGEQPIFRAGDHVGAEMIGKLSYYERWIVAFSNIPFRKQLLAPEELARKMDGVRARWDREAALGGLSSE